MFDDYDPLSFASTELLTNVFRAEIGAMRQLLAKHTDLLNLFDAPEATVPQRAACFALLAHRKLIEMIYDNFAARYEDSPSFSDAESDTLNRTHGLVAPDAPTWVQEMHQVVERLPAHIYTSLPESLRMGGFNPDNAEQMQAIQSAKKTLSTVEQIQTLTEWVLDQQLQRLERRWTAARPVANLATEIIVQGQTPTKRKGRRTRDRQRMSRDKVIAEIDDVSPTVVEFLKVMDERKVRPQPTWSGWPGSWSKAYMDPRLRKLIHQDKSRALARVQRDRQR
jgi:hypothetical protein